MLPAPDGCQGERCAGGCCARGTGLTPRSEMSRHAGAGRCPVGSARHQKLPEPPSAPPCPWSHGTRGADTGPLLPHSSSSGVSRFTLAAPPFLGALPRAGQRPPSLLLDGQTDGGEGTCCRPFPFAFFLLSVLPPIPAAVCEAAEEGTRCQRPGSVGLPGAQQPVPSRADTDARTNQTAARVLCFPSGISSGRSRAETGRGFGSRFRACCDSPLRQTAFGFMS